MPAAKTGPDTAGLSRFDLLVANRAQSMATVYEQPATLQKAAARHVWR